MCSAVKLSGLELGVSGPSVDDVTLVEIMGMDDDVAEDDEDDECNGKEPGRK